MSDKSIRIEQFELQPVQDVILIWDREKVNNEK
jgi:hypothetical protein